MKKHMILFLLAVFISFSPIIIKRLRTGSSMDND